jgi:hypothetical protein
LARGCIATGPVTAREILKNKKSSNNKMHTPTPFFAVKTCKMAEGKGNKLIEGLGNQINGIM